MGRFPAAEHGGRLCRPLQPHLRLAGHSGEQCRGDVRGEGVHRGRLRVPLPDQLPEPRAAHLAADAGDAPRQQGQSGPGGERLQQHPLPAQSFHRGPAIAEDALLALSRLRPVEALSGDVHLLHGRLAEEAPGRVPGAGQLAAPGGGQDRPLPARLVGEDIP